LIDFFSGVFSLFYGERMKERGDILEVHKICNSKASSLIFQS